jgi:hypothetical protein
MTNDVSADVAIQDSTPQVSNPAPKSAARTRKAAAAEKAKKPSRSQSAHGRNQKTPDKELPDVHTSEPDDDDQPIRSRDQGDPEPDSSGSDSSSDESSSDDNNSNSDQSDLEEEPEPRQHFKAVVDPFSPDWYRGKSRSYLEETLQVPGSYRNEFPRPFVIRDADFNRTLAGCSTGAKQEAEVLYTASAFLCLQLNRCNEFLEEHPKLNKDSRRHLEDNWLCQLGIYEYLLARLDIIEGLQGDSQSQALAEIQQARVRPLLGRGSISAETYQIYLPADTRAKVSAAASSKNRHSRGSSSAGKSRTPAKPSGKKAKPPTSKQK